MLLNLNSHYLKLLIIGGTSVDVLLVAPTLQIRVATNMALSPIQILNSQGQAKEQNVKTNMYVNVIYHGKM